MALDPQSERNIALKKLFAKAHTANTKGAANESIASQISIAANQVIGRVIPSNPATAISMGLAEQIEAVLVEDLTSNGKSYRCYFPSGYAGHFGSSVEGSPIGLTTFAIPFFYKNEGVQTDNSGGYTARLFDDGDEIFAVDSRDWVFDPFAVLITSEENLNLGSTGTMLLYLYTGPTVQSHIDDTNNPHNVTARQVGGVSEWQSNTSYEEGDLIFIDRFSVYSDTDFLNGIYVCITSHTSDSVSFINDRNNWKVLNSGYEHDQAVSLSDWQVDHNLGRYPTIMVIDSSGFLIEGEIEHVSRDRFFVRFNSPQTGKVYCT